jgi:PAS domain S-box-containing protein
MAAERATLLVVEDDTGLARLQQMRLERAGYAVLSAATAAEGLARLRAGGLDLVILDQRLPGGSGLEVYQQARAAGHDVPAILVTAVSDEQIVLQALRAGVSDFVPKTPNYFDYLLPAVERVLTRRRNERRLAESRAQLAAIVDTAMDAVLMVDEGQHIRLFNPAAEQTFGCPAGQAVGQPIARFLPDWPGPAPAGARHWETEGVRPGGERFPLEASLSSVELDGKRFWTCMARDVTERRRAQEEHARLIREQVARAEAERAEARLRELVERLQEQAHLLELAHALVRDNQDRIIFWNRGTTQMYGWSAGEAIGKVSHELLRTTFPVPRAKIDEELRARGQWEGELIHTRRDGTRLVVASHWALHRDARGRPVAVLEVNNDITELKRLQEALKEADRRKDAFLAVLAHELRNPLAPMRNALHLMRLAGARRQALDEARGVMERQVKQMVRLIDDLLDLSRISRGKIQLRKERVELSAAVDAAVESSRPLIDSAGHTLTVALPPEPVVLEADPTRLAQVLANLLNNAAKYTEPGGRINLSAERPGEQVVIRVKDTGVGIPPEALPRIFEMFTQVDRSPGRAQGGLGIGLSLVRGLVELHGGSVSAHSEGPGKGSEFVVRLPALPARTQPPARARAAGGDLPAPGPSRPQRVLVVEDNEDGGNSLAKLLAALGHEVRLARDGPAGLAEAETFAPEVVLLDIGLPGLDGYEVARRLRALPAGRDALLVAMTGWGQEEDRRRAQEAGFNAHLVKPVELKELARLLAAPAAAGSAPPGAERPDAG